MTTRPYRVLLADLKSSDITAEIPGLFVRAGFEVDVYCSADSWLRKTRHSRRWHPADTSDPRAFVRGLSEIVRCGGYDWVVLTDDFALRAVHDHAEEDVATRLLPVMNPEHRALAGSKGALSTLSKKYGIPTPEYRIINDYNNLEAAVGSLTYPLLLKVDRSGGGKGIAFCKDGDALRAAYAALSEEQRQSAVAQHYITGENISGEALFREGALVEFARARVEKNVKGEYSASCIRTYEPDPALTDLATRIGERFRLNGFCSFTFMKEARSGEYFLVEADLRTHSWFNLSRFAGVDFADAIRRYMQHAHPALQQDPRPIEVRHFERDVYRSIRERDVRNLLAWATGSDGRWRFIPRQDLHLTTATVASIARSLLYEWSILRPLGRLMTRTYRACVRAVQFTAPEPWTRSYIEYVRRERTRISLSALLALLQTALLTPIPIILQRAFDTALPSHDVTHLMRALFFAIGLLLGSTLLSLAQRYLTLAASKSIIAAIRMRLMRHLLAMSHATYATSDNDLIHSNMVQQTERLDRATNTALSQVLPAALAAAGLSVVLVYLNPLLFAISAISLPLIYLTGRRAGERVRESVRAYHTRFKEYSAGVSFILLFNELIALSGSSRHEIERQEGRIRELRLTSERMAWLSAVYGTLQSNVLVVCAGIVLLAGGTEVVRGIATVGSVLSFYVALNLLINNVRAITASVPLLIEGSEALHSITPLLETPDRAREIPHSSFDSMFPIAFESVSFGYENTELLRDASFTIDEGSITGIFGASGSGKTTLIRLLLGLYEPQHGAITIGGRSLQSIDLDQYRRVIGVLPQEPQLFSASIRENLIYGAGNVSHETIEATCKLCRIDETIERLPAGYDSVIGQRGVTLSGGQKQRLAIARALLRAPRLLILDEPDNNLDDALVNDIIVAVQTLGLTMIIVSHNASLRTNMQRVLTVMDGRVVANEPSFGFGATAIANSETNARAY